MTAPAKAPAIPPLGTTSTSIPSYIGAIASASCGLTNCGRRCGICSPLLIGITLPVPPSGNANWRMVNGRMLKSKPAREYRKRVQTICMAAGVSPLAGPVEVRVVWYRATRTGDLDNRLKVLLDAVNGLLYADDKQVVRIIAERREDPTNPRMELTVTEIL